MLAGDLAAIDNSVLILNAIFGVGVPAVFLVYLLMHGPLVSSLVTFSDPK